jgi:Protein of unknown function (DUF3037)
LSDRLPCEFFLIRYVPDAVKGEFTNIGVLLREAGRTDNFLVRFTRDWSRVKCMDADADIGLLEALEGEIDMRLKLGSADTKPVLSVIEDTFSNSIQMTEARACLAENMSTELELLLQMYVEPMKVKQVRTVTGRAAIARAMRNQFEHAGVWGLMRKRISASIYTLPGDPMKIDCGYRPNGVIRMFHAVSLDGDTEAAKGLAYSAPRLREGVIRVEGATLELTAVVEPLRAVPEESESAERYQFGVKTMESQEIRVITMNDLARAAETARIELRL